MKNKTTTLDVLEYLVVLLMFLVSGTQFFYIFYGRYTVTAYFVIGILYACLRHKKLEFSKGSFSFVIFWFLWTGINFFIINDKHEMALEAQYVLYTLIIIPTYLIISTFNFYRFRHIYLNVCVWLTLYSIFAYILYNLGMIHPTYVKMGNNPTGAMMSMFNCFGWRIPFERLAGLYWEPGAYSIILNTALILYIKEIKEWSLTRSVRNKLFIVLIALLMTKSTAGYICLIALIGVAAWYSGRLKKSFFMAIAGMAVLGGAVAMIYYSDTVQIKLKQRGYENTSYEKRLADNVAMVQMIKERPLLGYGLSTREFKIRSNELGNKTSSNGILKMTATFGLVFTLVYFLALFNALKIEYGRMTWLMFPLILILNAFEVFYYFPLAYIFIFSFNNFNRRPESEQPKLSYHE